MSMPKLFIFDLDGTLVDSKRDVVNSFFELLERRGFPAVEEGLVASCAAGAMPPLIAQVMLENGESDINSAFREFDAIYERRLLEHTLAYVGVQEVLEHFQGVKKVVLSRKPQRVVDRIIGGLSLSRHFDRCFGVEAFGVATTRPKAVSRVCETVAVSPNDSLMIGDTACDIRAAFGAGARSCAAYYGYGREEELRGLHPSFCIENVSDLLTLPL